MEGVDAMTVLDGEIVCVDKKGKPQFRDLLFRRGVPHEESGQLTLSGVCAHWPIAARF